MVCRLTVFGETFFSLIVIGDIMWYLGSETMTKNRPDGFCKPIT